MPRKKRALMEAVERVPLSRRGFITRVVGGAFVAPAIATITLRETGLLAASGPHNTVFGSSTPSTPRPSTTPSGSPIPSPHPSGSPRPCDPSQPTVLAEADSFIRSESPNTNEGANFRLRVGVKPISRAVIAFDRAQIQCRVLNATAVQLVLTIATNHNTWGQRHHRGVVAHPLSMPFVEGNGIQALMPDSIAQRGTGSGVTWRSPDDPDISNRTPNAHPRNAVVNWHGGAYGPPSGPPVEHQNLMTGAVAFDVLADVLMGATGWLLKIDSEHGDDDDRDDDDDHLLPGEERFAGVVEYYSHQGASDAGDYGLAPHLRFIY
jgi:hypothetical protein